MKRVKCLIIVILALAVTALSWGIGRADDAAQPPSQRTGQETTITDAAGRVHHITRLNRITPAQRKAAAEHRKAQQAAQQAQGNQGAAGPGGEVQQ